MKGEIKNMEKSKKIDHENHSGTNNCTSKLMRDFTDRAFRIPVFASSTNSINRIQGYFLDLLLQEIENVLLFPRTLPKSEQYPESSLTSIRRLILSSYGMLAVNFRRFLVKEMKTNVGPFQKDKVSWEGSPFAQIEPAMAYQFGLPLLLVRESGTDKNRGIWERGSAPFFILEWDSDNQSVDAFFQSVEWRETFANWVGHVRSGYYMQTEPTYHFRCNPQE